MIPSPGRIPESVSVIIPTLNGATKIGRQIAALATQTYQGPVEVIVAINGPDGGTADQVQQAALVAPHAMTFTTVDASQRPGVSAARNQGFALSSGELVLVCDDDDTVDPGWIQSYVDAAASYHLMGGPLVIDRTDQTVISALKPDLPNGPRIGHGFLPFAVGANFAAWAEAIDLVAGWNEHLRGGGDDVDISWRMQLRGLRFGFVPSAVVHYRFRQDTRGAICQAYAYGRAEPMLFALHRHQGVPRKPVTLGLKEVVHLLAVATPSIVLGHGGQWLTRAAKVAGRVSGSIRRRVWYI